MRANSIRKLQDRVRNNPEDAGPHSLTHNRPTEYQEQQPGVQIRDLQEIQESIRV